MDIGVARKPIADMDAYRDPPRPAARSRPPASCRRSPARCSQAAKKRIVFAEGEETSVIRAAYAFQSGGLGEAVLVGREELVRQNMRLAGLNPDESELEIINARVSQPERRIRRLPLFAPAARGLPDPRRPAADQPGPQLVRRLHGRAGHADGLVTGVTRSFDQALEEVSRAIDPAPGGRVIGMSIVLARGHTLFVADTNVTEMPEADDLVEIACEAARSVRDLGFTPKRRLHLLFRLRQSDGRAGREGARGGGHAGRDGRRLRVRGRDAAGPGARAGAAGELSRSCA